MVRNGRGQAVQRTKPARFRSSRAGAVFAAHQHSSGAASRRGTRGQADRILQAGLSLASGASEPSRAPRRSSTRIARRRTTRTQKWETKLASSISSVESGTFGRAVAEARRNKKRHKALDKTWLDTSGRIRGRATYSCPSCRSYTKVMRTSKLDDHSILRQRRCVRCKHTFHTREVIA